MDTNSFHSTQEGKSVQATDKSQGSHSPSGSQGAKSTPLVVHPNSPQSTNVPGGMNPKDLEELLASDALATASSTPLPTSDDWYCVTPMHDDEEDAQTPTAPEAAPFGTSSMTVEVGSPSNHASGQLSNQTQMQPRVEDADNDTHSLASTLETASAREPKSKGPASDAKPQTSQSASASKLDPRLQSELGFAKLYNFAKLHDPTTMQELENEAEMLTSWMETLKSDKSTPIEDVRAEADVVLNRMRDVRVALEKILAAAGIQKQQVNQRSQGVQNPGVKQQPEVAQATPTARPSGHSTFASETKGKSAAAGKPQATASTNQPHRVRRDQTKDSQLPSKQHAQGCVQQALWLVTKLANTGIAFDKDPLNYVILKSTGFLDELAGYFSLWLPVPDTNLRVIYQIARTLQAEFEIPVELGHASALCVHARAQKVFEAPLQHNRGIQNIIEALQLTSKLSNPDCTSIVLHYLDKAQKMGREVLGWTSSLTCPKLEDYLHKKGKHYGFYITMIVELLRKESHVACSYSFVPLIEMLSTVHVLLLDILSLKSDERFDDGTITTPIVHGVVTCQSHSNRILEILRKRRSALLECEDSATASHTPNKDDFLRILYKTYSVEYTEATFEGAVDRVRSELRRLGEALGKRNVGMYLWLAARLEAYWEMREGRQPMFVPANSAMVKRWQGAPDGLFW